MNTQLTTLSEQAKMIDKIAANALEALGGSGSFENAFAVADAMNSLREAITPEMMRRFMSLQNTSLGFRTDHDPSVKNWKTGEYPKPYGENVVKECVIEAVLRGVQTVGNQFNIIAHRCYLTKEGFEYKLKKLPGLSALKINIGVPRNVADKGAIVPCSATWTFKGTADTATAEIPIRVNDGMGADAVIGKAQRKFMKRIFEQITGTSEPEGEVESLALSAGTETAEVTETSSGRDLFPKSKAQSTPKTATSAGTTADSVKSSSPASSSSAPSAATKKGNTPQERLQKLVIENGYTWKDFKRWGVEAGEVDPDCQNFSQLPETETIVFIDRWDDILANLEKDGGK